MIWLLLSLAAATPLEYAALYGGIERNGYYFADLWVGTPPVKQTVIVDTGSRLTAFPCTGCIECGSHLDPYFDYHNSTTARLVGCNGDQFCRSCENELCTYRTSYAEGSSIAGILVEDLMMFGDSLDPSFQTRSTFGCHYLETKLFKTQEADGIMGLAHSDRNGKSIIDSMYAAQEITQDIFSLCLAHYGGFMVLGGFNSSAHLQPVKWVDMMDGNFYGVHFQGVSIGPTRLPLLESDFGHVYGTGSILDSGTTFVYLTTPVYLKLWEYFEAYCSAEGNCRGDRRAVLRHSHECFLYDSYYFSSLQEFFDSFPVITMDLGAEALEWRPENYLVEWTGHPDHYCIGIFDNGRSGNLLGALLMRGNDFVFDRMKERVGFAPSQCKLEAEGHSRMLQRLATSETEPQVNLWVGLVALLGLLGTAWSVCRCSSKYAS